MGYGRNRPDATHLTTGCLAVNAKPMSKEELEAKAAAKYRDEIDEPKPSKLISYLVFLLFILYAVSGRPQRQKALESRELMKRIANGIVNENGEKLIVTTTTRSGRQSRRPLRSLDYENTSDDLDFVEPKRKKRKSCKSVLCALKQKLIDIWQQVTLP